ncbi:MAG TPA: DUF3465 domain-containing protein [Woeseiaceae bacterium]
MTAPYAKADSGTWIEARGLVIRLLSDDAEPERHQRFVIDAGGGHTLLVLHNLDLAPRVPAGLGDRVRVRGLYEWNERGGLVHWTHRDPMENEGGGFIRHRRQTYR